MPVEQFKAIWAPNFLIYIHCSYLVAAACTLAFQATHGIPSQMNAEETPSSCQKCEKWHTEERRNMSWLGDLNSNFKCPCKVVKKSWLGGFYGSLNPVDNPSNKIWKADLSCMINGRPWCAYYHHGADGCLRSKELSKFGARQQCCYDTNGNIIKPGLLGAGTPDRSGSFFGHLSADVWPFDWCCKECKQLCHYYIDDVRRGNIDHCA